MFILLTMNTFLYGVHENAIFPQPIELEEHGFVNSMLHMRWPLFV